VGLLERGRLVRRVSERGHRVPVPLLVGAHAAFPKTIICNLTVGHCRPISDVADNDADRA
jgi:hypothetical protein